MAKGDTLLNAVVGAVVTVLLSFTGVAPVLGGAVAGYLQRESRASGAKVGALSGAIAFLPALLFLFVVMGFFALGPMMGGTGLPGGVELLVVVLILFPLFVLWHVGLGALGGYLGAYVREEW
jgi:hypothetical protein